MTQPNIFISCKESRIENNKSFYGCFYLGPFDSGQSLTIANALRRTLLSECTGLGIVSVTIDHVNHEYSTIPGVRESVLDLLLNLKEVVLRKKSKNFALYKKNSTIYNQVGVSYFKPVSGFLKVKGPGVIRAKDLKLPPFLECVDPEQYIATLADDGFLCMKFIIMEGKGYLVPQFNRLSRTQNRMQPSFTKNKQGQTNEESQTRLESSNFILASSEVDQRVSAVYSTKRNDENKNAELDDNLNFDLVNDSEDQATTNYIKKRLNFIQEIQQFKKQSDLQEHVVRGAEGKEMQGRTGNQSQRKNLKGTKGSSFVGFETYLNLDTVFNPVTKVSYILEDFDNKILDDSNSKINFVDHVSDLIESSYYLKKNFPSLYSEVNKNNDSDFDYVQNSRSGNLSDNKEKTNKLNDSVKTRENFFKFIDTYSPSEIENLSYYLYPLKKQNPKQNIILEIWTNGSLHPRDALYTAFEKLSSVFLNIQKTPTYSSMYVNESSLLIAGLNLSNNRLSEIQTLQTQVSDEVGEALGKKNISLLKNKEENMSINNFMNNNIECLNFSLRPYTLLKRANIHTLSDLCKLTKNDLKSICGFNHKYITHILNVMTKNGLTLKN